MKKGETSVPKGGFSIDSLEAMGRSFPWAWTYIHRSIYEDLLATRGATKSIVSISNRPQEAVIEWKGVRNIKVTLKCEVPSSDGWGKLTGILIDDKNFGIPTDNPEQLFFLKLKK